MLRGSKNKILIISTLCCLLVFMGIGYAILSTRINLLGDVKMTGVWDIEIIDMKVLSKKGIAKEGNYKFDGLKAEFSHELYAPGDSIEYEITIKNKGNIKASLNQVASTVTSEYQDLILSHSLSQGQTLEGGETLKFTIKSEFDIKATSVPNAVIAPKYEIELLFYQYEGNEIITPPNMDADNVCFMVSNTGELTDYDYEKCGSTMTVPESINGINVTKISNKLFDGKKYNDSIQSLGYIRYKSITVHTFDFSSYYYYNFFETEEDKMKYLEENDLIEQEEILNSRIYAVVDLDNIENHKLFVPHYYAFIDDTGEWIDDPQFATHLVYEYYDDNGDAYIFVDDESDLEAARLYNDNYWGLPQENVLVIGDSNINFRYEFLLSELSDGDFETNSYKNLGDYGKKIINTLDLSNANFLTEIAFSRLVVNNLYLPDSLTKISTEAFMGSTLTNVTIPSKVTQIGASAFSSMKVGSVIKVNRPRAGMSLGASWSGAATVRYST